MGIIRVNKTKDYTIMSNYHFKEKEMSLKAKGLLSEMLSLPDEWDYSIEGLTKINKENETSIKTTLDELKHFKYLIVTKKMPNETASGRIEYIYDIYEQPYRKQEGEKQGLENLGVENQGLENQGQYNTNNKYINNKELNINKKENIKEKFIKPTLEQVQEYCKERNNNVVPERFIDFYESKGWMVGKNKMKDWRACIRTWEQKDKGGERLPDWMNNNNQREITQEEQDEFNYILNNFH